jgi:hypothetical protein
LGSDAQFLSDVIGPWNQDRACETGTDSEEAALNQYNMFAKPGPMLERILLASQHLMVVKDIPEENLSGLPPS